MSRQYVSVALCTYNGARYLTPQLASILSQTLSPDELVICDDGSEDGTLDLLRAFSQTARFAVRIFENQHARLGSTKNFEKAIELCTGDLIALADQDDVWRPHKLDHLCRSLGENPSAGYAFSDAELVSATGRGLGQTLWNSV